MVNTHALMESVSANLREFFHSITTDPTRPQKEFRRDARPGRLVNGCRLLELQASVPRRDPMPILLGPFSYEHSSCPGPQPGHRRDPPESL